MWVYYPAHGHSIQIESSELSTHVIDFLLAWEASPEDCLRQMFGAEPPIGSRQARPTERSDPTVPAIQSVAGNPEDMGL